MLRVKIKRSDYKTEERLTLVGITIYLYNYFSKKEKDIWTAW